MLGRIAQLVEQLTLNYPHQLSDGATDRFNLLGKDGWRINSILNRKWDITEVETIVIMEREIE